MKTNAKLTIVMITLGIIACVAFCVALVATAQDSGSAKASSDKGGMVKVRLVDDKGQPGPVVSVAKVVKTDEEWRKQLTKDQYEIARAKGTERAFCGAFFDNHKPGIYYCVCCDLPLFTSETKFDSGTGWPSFFQPVAAENIDEHKDLSFGMERTEILCARCGAHLGHVFDDGPKPTRLQYCINSASLVFKDNTNLVDSTSPAKH
jgi:methionine-R-sulfoxide reductase